MGRPRFIPKKNYGRLLNFVGEINNFVYISGRGGYIQTRKS